MTSWWVLTSANLVEMPPVAMMPQRRVKGAMECTLVVSS